MALWNHFFTESITTNRGNDGLILMFHFRNIFNVFEACIKVNSSTFNLDAFLSLTCIELRPPIPLSVDTVLLKHGAPVCFEMDGWMDGWHLLGWNWWPCPESAESQGMRVQQPKNGQQTDDVPFEVKWMVWLVICFISFMFEGHNWHSFHRCNWLYILKHVFVFRWLPVLVLYINCMIIINYNILAFNLSLVKDLCKSKVMWL